MSEGASYNLSLGDDHDCSSAEGSHNQATDSQPKKKKKKTAFVYLATPSHPTLKLSHNFLQNKGSSAKSVSVRLLALRSTLI